MSAYRVTITATVITEDGEADPTQWDWDDLTAAMGRSPDLTHQSVPLVPATPAPPAAPMVDPMPLNKRFPNCGFPNITP